MRELQPGLKREKIRGGQHTKLSSGLHIHVHEHTQTHKEPLQHVRSMAPGFHFPKGNTSKDLLQAVCVGGDPETTGRSSSETCLWIVESLGVFHPPKMFASQGGGIRVHVILRIGATQTRVCVSHTVLCISIQHSLQAFSVLLKGKVTVVAMVMPKPLFSCLYVWLSCSPARCWALLSRKHCHRHT